MFTLKSATILALVGSALATPIAHHHRDNYQVDRPEVGRAGGEQGIDGKYVVVVTTTGPGNNPNPPAAYQPPTTTSGGSKPSSTAGSPAPSNTGTTGTSPSGTGYIAIANKWRSAMGFQQFKQSSDLEANILDTLQRSPGVMAHHLNPGSFGQVLAPGGPSDFEHVYVGGWLCERPDKDGLNGICTTQSKGWQYDHQTGHADILNGAYTKIGCANFQGIWGCDVA